MRLHTIIPNFSAETTIGPIKFHDWQCDSWVVLFSHPHDFTPVCTSELCEIALLEDQFARRNVKLLAHSVDDLESHLEWLKDIKSSCLGEVSKFPYPIIADPTRYLAVALEMIDEEQKNDIEVARTIRALYIIDPKHRLRALIMYPELIGRNSLEILRVVDSLQLTDKNPYIATPANCRVIKL
ncbi:peroxiredoxin PRX1, mitochondrial-like isoform X2 [Contarinia nasturtii]|uniref:peroxiredoxin PRX1, mitochondrial-like isoform X2 n=1 Tax=Contarinia nasturtii TaxID=265458 RepID=UPI0012D3BDED|nr:peroxiredoxin PRX1, mitochondrial-like isoform X2 [Contarinia nasturtii]